MDFFDFEKTSPEPDELLGKYRQLFLGSDLGMEVLSDILRECHFGSTLNLDNPHQIAEYNVAVILLAKLGIFGKGTLREVINSLANVYPDKED